MVDQADAKKIAQAYFDVESKRQGYHFIVWEDNAIEKEYGWIIRSVAQEYLDRDPRLMIDGVLLHLIGGYPNVVVERESGSLYPLSTSYHLREGIADYEAWRFFNLTSLFYDLTVRSVRDLEKTLELLSRVTLMYDKSFPLQTGGEGVLPSAYRDEELRELLRQVPITFHHQDIRRFFRVFEEMDAAGCCAYVLVPSED